MKNLKVLIFFALSLMVLFQRPLIAGAGRSSGSTLLMPAGAAPTALGEAYSAATDDICAMRYNPASLSSLKNGHVSFLYQKALADDSMGQLMVGTPYKKNHAFGFSIGTYDGGELTLRDGNRREIITAKKDLVINFGYGRQLKKTSVGITGKYLSSELVGYKASAVAFDLGLQQALRSRFRLGLSLQNFGTGLKYADQEEKLPRMITPGFSYQLKHGRYESQLSLDIPYLLNEKKNDVAMGVETRLGLLAVRMGYRSGRELQKFSMGAGVLMGRMTFDYAVGLVDKLDARHLASLSLRFGGAAPMIITGKPKPPAVKKPTAVPVAASTAAAPATPVETISPATSRPIQPQESISLPAQTPKEEVAQPTAPAAKPEPPAVKPTPEVKKPEIRKENAAKVKKPAPVKRTVSQQPRRKVYVIQAGDTFESIAEKIYGDKGEWKRIYYANRELLKKSKNLVGEKIILP